MKIHPKVLTAFVGYLKNSGHGINEKNGCLVMRRGVKDAIIDCRVEENITVNDYGYRLYMTFMHRWLNEGKRFLSKMQQLGLMIVSRVKGRNYIDC